MTIHTVDDLLEKLRAQLTTRRQESEERVARIKIAADDYLRAIEADLVSDVAVKLGVDTQRSSTAVKAMLTLRSLVESLPEARVRTEPAVPSETRLRAVAEIEEHREDEAHHDETRVPVPSPAPRRIETDPEVEALFL